MTLAVTGDATLDADNDFTSVQGTAANLTVKDVNDLDLAGVTVGGGSGELNVTAGSLTDSAANAAGAVTLAVTGDATLDADNDFDTITGSAGNLSVNDKDDLKIKKIETSGYATFKTGDALTVSETVNAGGNVMLNATKGGVSIDSNVVGGQNVTVESAKGDVKQNANVTATAGDVLYVAENGNVLLGKATKAGNAVVAKAKNDVVLSGDGSISTKNLGVDAGKTAKLEGAVSASGDMALKTGGDITITGQKNALNVAAQSTGGNVMIDTAGPLTILASAEVKAAEVDFAGKTPNAVAVKADGIQAGKTTDIKASSVNERGSASVSGATTRVVTGDYTVANTESSGKLVLDVGGKATVSKIEAGSELVLDVGRDLSASGDVTAGGAADVDVGGNASVGGKLGASTLDGEIAGNLTAGTVEASGAISPLHVGGTAGIGTLAAGQIDEMTVGGGAKIDEIGVSKNANVTIGGNLENARGTTVGGNLNFDVKGSMTSPSITAGSIDDLKTGGDLKVSDALKVNGSAEEINVGGNYDVKTTDIHGDATLNVKGSVTGTDMTVGGHLEANTGDLRFNTMTAGNVTWNAGSIAMGKVSATDATFDAKGSITDNGSEVATKSLTMKATGDIGSSSAPIQTKTSGGTLVKISGNDVYLKELGRGVIYIGSIEAGNRLELTVPNLGKDGKGKLLPAPGGGHISAGKGGATLDVAGHVGWIGQRLKIDIQGPLDLKSGALDGRKTNNGYVYVIVDSKDKDQPFNVVQYWKNWIHDPNLKDQEIPGLVIIDGQVVAGKPELTRAIDRAEAFTIETPELKSVQGVFGQPLFVHTDMDVSEAASIGSVDHLRVDPLSFEPVEDATVRNQLRKWGSAGSFAGGRREVSKYDEIYTRSPKPETAEEKAAREEAEKEAAKAKAAEAKAKADAKAKAKAEKAAAEAKAKAEKEAAAKAKAEAKAKAKADKAAAEAKAKAEKEAAAKAKAEAETKAK